MAWNTQYPLGRLLSQSRLPALDGLRFVAVLLVIVYHAGYEWVPADLGVDAFFVLSGFLITWLLLREYERAGTISLKTFYVRRAYRLLPAYYVFLAISLTIYYARGHGRTDILLPSFFYYTNYFNALHDHPPTPISHTWSLAVEEQFYLLWPVAFLWLSAKSWSAVTRFLVISIAAIAAWRCFLFLGLHVSTAYVYNAFDTRFDTLAIGCLLAIASKHDRFLQAARAMSGHWAMPLPTIALLLAIHEGEPDAFHYSLGFSVQALLLGIAILQILQLAQHRAWRWLEHPVIRYLGSISYPIYLYHGFGRVLANRLDFLPLPVATVINGAVVVLLASLSYRFVEQPFLRRRQRLTERATT